MVTKLLVLLKSVDGGTGTYLEGLLDLKTLYDPRELVIKVLVLEKPKYRTINVGSYTYFPRRNNIVGKYYLTLNSLSVLVRELSWFTRNEKEFQPDIVLSSDAHSILISEISRLIHNFKYSSISVIQNNLRRVIDYRLPELLRSPIKYLLTIFLNKSDQVVTVSKYLSKDIFKDYKLECIPKTISAILPIRISKKMGNKTNMNHIVITIARLDLQKDFETLIKAFKLVKQKIDDSELWIVGDGPQKKQLQLLSKKLGIDKNIKFLGWSQNPEKLLDVSRVFVLSSKWEGFPLSLLEAMNRGLPVVASDCKYGPSEILENNKYGILFPVGDISSLADAIILLLSDNRKFAYYSQMAKIRVQEYSREVMLAKYKAIVEGFRDARS